MKQPRKPFPLGLALAVLLVSAAGAAWSEPFAVDLTFVLDGREALAQTRTFAGHPEASTGFDTARDKSGDTLDRLGAPPGQTFYAYFRLASFPYFTWRDTRPWRSPFQQPIDWQVVILNAGGATTEITWDPDRLPEINGGQFLLNGVHDGPVDMNALGQARVTGDAVLELVYRHSVQAPQAAFSLSPSTGPAPLPVHFKNQTTGSQDSVIWSFGDGTFSADVNPIHLYTRPGLYSVTLTVYGAGGENSTIKTGAVSVHHPAPVADFSAFPTSGAPPLQVRFKNQSSGAISRSQWDFGDSEHGNGAHPLHTYSEPGRYTISLTVTGPGGDDTRIREQYIEVGYPAPVTTNRSGERPAAWRLGRCYPNPFNTSTLIPFELPRESALSLTLFDCSGRRVRVLASGTWPGGEHVLKVDGSGLAAGIYFYCLECDAFRASAKMVLLK